MTTKVEIIPWTEPSERKRMELIPGDIQAALEWYEDQKTGQKPDLIIVNPRHEQLALKETNGILLKTSRGCLAWEIWLLISDTNKITPPEATESISGPSQQNTKGIPLPPFWDNIDPSTKIALKLHGEGFTVRAIAAKLGTTKSAIHRAIQKAQLAFPLEDK